MNTPNSRSVMPGDTYNGSDPEGFLTRDEFLAFTSVPDVPRRLDESKIQKVVSKDPQRGLEILAAISVTGSPTASIVAPKK